MNFQLSEHFWFNELTSTGREDLQILNREEALRKVESLKALCLLLEKVRIQFSPMLITSGFRCPAVNIAVGGSPTSQHVLAEAADFIVPGTTPEEIFGWLRKQKDLNFGQAILEPTWVHLSLGKPFRPADKCRQYLQYMNGKYIPKETL